MTERERFICIMQFQPVDKVLNYELGLLKGGAERWYNEGLPEGVHWKEYFGIGDFRHTADAPGMFQHARLLYYHYIFENPHGE